QQSPVADARWALDEVRRQHGAVPIVLVGHSMGGRTALHVADDPSVVGVCALAPWIERADSADRLAGKALLVVHGGNDRTTSPRRSAGFARAAEQAGASVEYVRVVGGHAMLVRAGRWHRLATNFTLRTLDAALTPS
ncbi:MAG TPA: alpha/beta fold hydrolase, partial [Mycobacteriales bacterium]|nr:alpha/beta fold hydrolase [Mycobacteriales bacterium]